MESLLLSCITKSKLTQLQLRPPRSGILNTSAWGFLINTGEVICLRRPLTFPSPQKVTWPNKNSVPSVLLLIVSGPALLPIKPTRFVQPLRAPSQLDGMPSNS